MITFKQLLKEIKISPKMNDTDLLRFLKNNRGKLIKILDNELLQYFDEDDREETITSLLDSEFEMDDNDNPSIGDGTSYFSFSMFKEMLEDDGQHKPQKIKIGNIEFYTIYYEV